MMLLRCHIIHRFRLEFSADELSQGKSYQPRADHKVPHTEIQNYAVVVLYSMIILRKGMTWHALSLVFHQADVAEPFEHCT
jgi:hypothetical protein